MRIIDAVIASAKAAPDKAALITENNQLLYRDILWMLHILSEKFSEKGIQSESTVVCDTDRAELDILFNLMTGLKGVHVIHAGFESVSASKVPFDFYVGIRPIDTLAEDQQLIVQAEWFADMPFDRLPNLEPSCEVDGTSTHLSSGTTGVAKFIKSTSYNRTQQLANRETVSDRNLQVQRSDRVLCTLSPETPWAMSVNTSALAIGASAVALSAHRDKLMQYIDLYRITYLVATPIAMRAFLEVQSSDQMISSLRVLMVGGAYAGNELLKKFTDRFPITVVVGYGTSEIGAISRKTYADSDAQQDGYIGEYHRTDVEIGFFDEDLNRLDGATEGVVGFRPYSSDALPVYIGVNGEEANSESLVDGFFFPGDMMRLDGTKLFITGRVKNVINISGNKVSLLSIQSLLEEHFPDASFVCVAITGEFDMDELVAFHDNDSPINLDQINNVLSTKFQTVRAVDVVNKKKFRQTPTGKVDIQFLRAEYLAKQS
jgi:acyl-coenzyme A synthetase/AMP-(fatty) acid ligase